MRRWAATLATASACRRQRHLYVHQPVKVLLPFAAFARPERIGAIVAPMIASLPSSQPDRAVLAGTVERVTFHNAESGFCVLRIKARAHRDLVTIVGHAATIAAGEWITASGEWVNDRTHGQQFKARFLRTSAPSSIEGIEKYLASGMIRGIGPVYARKMVRAFGEAVFDIIDTEPDRMREVDGIGPIRARRITAAGRSRRSCARSWSSCTATALAPPVPFGFTRLTAPMPSR
jgi:hypothetical protein